MEQFRKAQKVKLTLKSPFNSRIHRVPSIIEALVKAPFFIMLQGLCPKMDACVGSYHALETFCKGFHLEQADLPLPLHREK
eukprot:738721-Ditylum_brightwellii.AAC.1